MAAVDHWKLGHQRLVLEFLCVWCSDSMPLSLAFNVLCPNSPGSSSRLSQQAARTVIVLCNNPGDAIAERFLSAGGTRAPRWCQNHFHGRGNARCTGVSPGSHARLHPGRLTRSTRTMATLRRKRSWLAPQAARTVGRTHERNLYSMTKLLLQNQHPEIRSRIEHLRQQSPQKRANPKRHKIGN